MGYRVPFPSTGDIITAAVWNAQVADNVIARPGRSLDNFGVQARRGPLAECPYCGTPVTGPESFDRFHPGRCRECGGPVRLPSSQSLDHSECIEVTSFGDPEPQFIQRFGGEQHSHSATWTLGVSELGSSILGI